MSQKNISTVKIKEAIKILIAHSLFFVIGTALFVFLFHIDLFKNVGVFFYRGIILLWVTCIITALLQYLFKQAIPKGLFTYRDIILSCVLIFSFNIVFFTHLPVTADRSLTIFILGQMNNSPEKIMTDNMMATLFSDKYLFEYGELDRRFNEQIVSGNLVKVENGYKISRQGQTLMMLYRYIAVIFGIDKQLVSP